MLLWNDHKNWVANHVWLALALFLVTSCSEPEVEHNAAAHWISSGTLVWNVPLNADRYSLELADTTVELRHMGSYADSSTQRYRHLLGWPMFEVDLSDELLRSAIQGRITAMADDRVVSRVQFAGLLDERYAYDGDLGPVYHLDRIEISIWAPTAQNVALNLFSDDKVLTSTVQADAVTPAPGVWRFTVGRDQDRAFYTFSVTVYHPETDTVQTLDVTDPYSVSLSANGRHSQLIDLAGARDLKPTGWDNLNKRLPRATDITLYEGHVRDFSLFDESVPAEHRGKYLAFTHTNSTGMRHLKRLADAGMSHLHLLPVNDIGSVNEVDSTREDVSDSLRSEFAAWADADPATMLIQQRYSEPSRSGGMAAKDGYNWGYDPVHYNVPEGSYATEPDGPTRVKELREMVGALHRIGLNLVVDVVYNHTYEDGLRATSVLDKIVPGYYHRYDPVSGKVETSTCCFNTAAENTMMERLIIDSVILWAKQYKIDAFRFDLMGHHPKAVMQRLRERLASLTLENDGVDGANIYIYGEGWNFGEVADNRIFEQATQFNMGGTGIGNFNDRMRDAIRGGNFTDRGRNQGFTNGLYLFPNEDAGDDRDAQKAALLDAADRIRVGLVGNLSTYMYRNRFGDVVPGSNEWIGYTRQPQETINYIDKHDNETLWDNTQTKLPLDMGMEERVKVHLLSNAMINYGQGVPFFHMGTDILRSKSLDRNSFDSGDWYNTVDFTLDTHNWARGLPPAWDNETRWDAMRRFFAAPAIRVEKAHLQRTHQGFLEQLRIRYSTPLFRMLNADDIHRRIVFHNTGPDQVPGLIVMSISDAACGGEDLDPALDALVVVFNATLEPVSVTSPAAGVRVHPMSTIGEAVDGAQLRVPALSAGVFVKPQRGARGEMGCNTRM